MPYGPDYAAWVASQKPKWRAVRQDNKRRKVEAAKAAEAARRAGVAAGAAAAATGPLSMRSLLANQNAAVTAVPWQVLQLAETATPGQLKVRRGGRSGSETALLQRVSLSQRPRRCTTWISPCYTVGWTSVFVRAMTVVHCHTARGCEGCALPPDS